MRTLQARTVVLLAAALAAQANSAPRSEAPDMPGAAGQRSFQVGEFNSVLVEGSSRVVVTVGGAPSVRAEGDSEMIERLAVRVDGGSLRIGHRQLGEFDYQNGGGPVTVFVSAPRLSAAATFSSGPLQIDRVEGETFEAAIVGSGSIEIMDLRARRVSFSLSGSGSVRAAGDVDTANVLVRGSGRAALDQLHARRVALSAIGSGSVSVRASEVVEGAAAGSGDVVVHGTASCSISKMGSGDVRCGGEEPSSFRH